MKTLQILSLIALIATSAHAHLGWTLEQCTNEYGKPKVVEKPSGNGYIFISKPYIIVVMFDKSGKADIVNYSFAPSDTETSPETQKLHLEAIIKKYPEFLWKKNKELEKQGIDARVAKTFDGGRVFIERKRTEILVSTSKSKKPN